MIYRNNIKRYKPFFIGIHNKTALQEAIINPNNYLRDIDKKLDKLLNRIINKNYDAKKVCRILSVGLSRYKIEIIYQNSIERGLDINIRFGINSGACLPDRYSSIGIFCNDNIIRIQDNIDFRGQFKNWFLLVLKHELIHRGQNLAVKDIDVLVKVKSNEKEKFKQELSNPIEIMARAWESVEIFKLVNHLENNDIINILKNYSKYALNNTLNTYIELFKKDSKELRLLFKYMYLYLTEN